MKKKASGTHRSKGKTGGTSVGVDTGLSSVQKFKAGQGAEICHKTQRPKSEKGGSIAV